MDRARFSRIAHGDLAWAAPVDRAAVDQAMAALGTSPDDHAFDVGCGRGAFLLGLAEHSGCRGTGIDIDAESIRAARSRVDTLGLGDRVRFEVCDAADFGRDARFDLAVCIGSSHACGGFGPALDYLVERTGDSTRLLVGEGFWRKDPDPDYLAHIGAQADEMGSHWDNVETARARSLVPLWSLVSSDTAWDRYEGLYRLNMARHLARNPDDPEHDAFRRHSERWYTSYLRWGRETMGFALYLFGKALA
jgi:SAM-dependent methyltransferase